VRSFIAARSSSVNPLEFLPVAVVLLVEFCGAFFSLISFPPVQRLSHVHPLKILMEGGFSMPSF
jgi:hypothetical protein